MAPIGFEGGVQVEKNKKSVNANQIIEIEALIVNGSHKVAKISGRSYVIGDLIGPFTIKDISVDRVLLEDQDTKDTQEIHVGHSWSAEQKNKGVQ